jgi:hypothetical protein
MSKLARFLAVIALLATMSLGSAAHAQSGDSPSQPAGATQPAPNPNPPPNPPRTRTRTPARPLPRPRCRPSRSS